MLSIVASQIVYPELILRSSVSIANSLVTSVKYLISISKDDIDLQTLLITNDIIEDINVIKTFIHEKQDHNTSDTVKLCIDNLSKTLEDLEKHINSITNKIENHKTLWFNYFRSYNITHEKAVIPLLIRQMKHRFDLLVQITSSLN
jgi:phenylalanyl-tRNA synthetase alpha subunit